MIAIEYTPVHYDDIYFAEVAHELLEFVAELDTETCALAMTCAAYCAECDLSLN